MLNGVSEQWERQLQALGSYIRAQRKVANLSLRQLADLTAVSNPYLSQVERGLHQPSVRVLRAIAQALNISAETLLTQAGLLAERDEAHPPAVGVEAAIQADPMLSKQNKQALLTVYRSMLHNAES
ncbi:MAG TPA: helix-turn-helix transcriptional regulator [Sporichthyaceae bacterium]|jgi:transcriptional regulator with XRE-family HTH domain